MFKHLLVPTDGSTLSQDTVARAVSFAREAGSRITLFYAEHGVPVAYDGMGALSSTHLTQDMKERLDGAAREILDAAEAVAREAGAWSWWATIRMNSSSRPHSRRAAT